MLALQATNSAIFFMPDQRAMPWSVVTWQGHYHDTIYEALVSSMLERFRPLFSLSGANKKLDSIATWLALGV